MYKQPTKVDLPDLTSNTIYESYDTALELSDSNRQSHEYASVDTLRDTSTGNLTSGKDKPASDMKFRCFCVTFLVVAVVLLLASLACASIALWMTSMLKADNSKLAGSKGNQVAGQEESNPVASCFLVHLLDPFLPSGYYWVRSSDGSAVRVYCDMTRSCGGVTGGWRRVVDFDFSSDSSPCPAGLVVRGYANIRTCGIESSSFSTCVSVMLPSSNISYTRVCGRIIAFQYGSTDAFADFGRGTRLTIDSNYVDGVSLTYGSRPRTHIWTFVAALDDVPSTPISSCQCSVPNAQIIPLPPLFVGQDYFCSTGSHLEDPFFTFYNSDPLWDGAGCSVNSTCCSFNNPPWFYKQLPSATTEDIEMRVCIDEPSSTEDIALSQVEIYVQ